MYPWIYAHRGLWKTHIKQNSSEAIREAVLSGFSVETDLRDYQGEIVLSHDPVTHHPELKLIDLLDLGASFALNIKSDGLFSMVTEEVSFWVDQTSSFFFDGSFPDLFRYHQASLPIAYRLSEYETIPELDPISMLWIDGLDSDWWIGNKSIIEENRNSKIIFVSPELHGRDPKLAWLFLREARKEGYLNVNICTDFPQTVAKW
jgi:hypothetical protein